MAEADKVIKFFHGPYNGIQGKIEDGTINESDIVITSDTDEIVYIDETKTQKPLGSSKSKQEIIVELGAGGSVGGLSTGDAVPAGTTLDELITMLTQKAVPPTYIQPGVTCRVSAGDTAKSYEAGTNINTTIQGLFTQNDAGALTTIEIKKDNESVLSQGISPVTTDAQEFQIGDNTVSFTATATYADGPIKNNNLDQPDDTGQIKAGSKTSAAVSFVGKRNLFYGTGVGSVPEINSENIRALTNKELGPTNGKQFTINVSVGQQYVIFAYPETLRDVSQVLYVETNDKGMATSFTKNTIQVFGANNYNATGYKVYSYGMAVPAAAPMTFEVTI